MNYLEQIKEIADWNYCKLPVSHILKLKKSSKNKLYIK